jgi:hypothetical protein
MNNDQSTVFLDSDVIVKFRVINAYCVYSLIVKTCNDIIIKLTCLYFSAFVVALDQSRIKVE